MSLMKDAQGKSSCAASYEEFLRVKVGKARESMRAGKGAHNDQIEDKFASRRNQIDSGSEERVLKGRNS